MCVKQFRPPLDTFTIELTAGLIDPNFTAAVWEFREETGYIGKVINVLPTLYLSPGLTNKSATLFRLEVDMTLDHNIQIHNNQIKNSDLDESKKDRELEKKLLLPRVGLLEVLHDLQTKNGAKMFAVLYSLAMGMSVGEKGW